MAAPKTWTDGEVLELVRAVLVVRDAGLMQRMQAVWGGGDSAGLSPLSGFFKRQARRYDLFGFGHEAYAEFWRRIGAALEGREYERATEKIALQRHVREILDFAATAEVYASRQRLGEEAIGYAHDVKWQAWGQLGDLLKEAAEGGLRHTQARGRPKISVPAGTLSPATLSAMGLKGPQGRKIAMIALQLADLSEEARRAIRARETTLTEARRQTQHAARPTLVLPDGTYRVIYADPPWQYRDTRGGLGADTQGVDRAETAAAQDYPTMDVETLCDLKVSHRVPADAVLFCWATFPLLPSWSRSRRDWRVGRSVRRRICRLQDRPGKEGLRADPMIAVVLLSGLLVAPSGAVYDARGQRHGYVQESRPGQFDLYDAHSRRLGYGRQGRDGTVEFFDTHSRRLLEIRPERPGPRR